MGDTHCIFERPHSNKGKQAPDSVHVRESLEWKPLSKRFPQISLKPAIQQAE